MKKSFIDWIEAPEIMTKAQRDEIRAMIEETKKIRETGKEYEAKLVKALSGRKVRASFGRLSYLDISRQTTEMIQSLETKLRED